MNIRYIVNRIFGNKIVKASYWYIIGNSFLKGIVFLTIPIFTRILTTEEYGEVSLYFTWVSITAIIIGTGLYESLRRGKFEYPGSYDNLVQNILILSISIFIIYFLIGYFVYHFLKSYISYTPTLLILLFSHAFANHIFELTITKLRFQQKYKTLTLINIFVNTISVILSILLIIYVFKNDGTYGRILGFAIPFILTSFIMILYLLKPNKLKLDFRYWKFGLVLGLPLVFHALGLIINTQFDRIVINQFWGASLTGIYSSSYQIGLIVQVIFISIDQAWTPWFFKNYNNGLKSEIIEKSKLYRMLFTLIFICILYFVPEFVYMIVPETYFGGILVIPLIFLGYFYLFLYSFEVNIEYANKKVKYIALGTSMSALLNIILNYIFVPRFGIIAAASTTTFTYVFLLTFHYYITHKKLKNSFYEFKFYIKPILISTLAIALFYIFYSSFIVRIFIAILLLILITILDRKQITKFLKLIKKDE